MVFTIMIMKYNDNINQDKNNNNSKDKHDKAMTKNNWTVSKLTKLINHNDK